MAEVLQRLLRASDKSRAFGLLFRVLANDTKIKDEGKSLRILTFASLFPNACDLTHGIFIYQRSLHLGMRPGLEVKVVAPVPYFPRWLNIGKWGRTSKIPWKEDIGGLSIYHPRYFLLPKVSMPYHALSMFLSCMRFIVELNRTWKIDCIDAHFVYPDGMAAVLLGKWLGIRVIVSARGSDINVYPGFRLIKPLIRWTVAKADALITVSSALKEKLIDLGANESKIRVIPNGVDIRIFGPLQESEARKVLGLPAQGPIIVSVGSLIPSKGHALLVAAIQRIITRHPDLKLYIIGEGPEKSELERRIKDSDLEGVVELVGKKPNPELAQWFSAATISCLLSSREGWPNVITESLACGTPVVATSAGGIPEIINSPELGLIVDRTVEAAAMGLEEGITKTWNRQAIALRGRSRTWDQVAGEIEAFVRAQM